MKTLWLLAFSTILLAESKDPLTDRLRFEIAVAQRDFVVAKNPYDAALEKLRAKIGEANAVCQKAKKVFDDVRFVCVEPRPDTKHSAPSPENTRSKEQKPEGQK